MANQEAERREEKGGVQGTAREKERKKDRRKEEGRRSHPCVYPFLLGWHALTRQRHSGWVSQQILSHWTLTAQEVQLTESRHVRTHEHTAFICDSTGNHSNTGILTVLQSWLARVQGPDGPLNWWILHLQIIIQIYRRGHMSTASSRG